MSGIGRILGKRSAKLLCVLFLLALFILSQRNIYDKREIDIHDKREIDIHVFTWKRSKSLSRLLNSLNNADYSSTNTKIMLIIHVDAEGEESVDRVLFNFEWKFGKNYYKIIKSQERIGLQNMMINSWDYSKYSLFLEDDIQVSPFYFTFLQKCLQFLQDKNLDLVFGCSLYTPRIDEITNGIKGNRPLWNFRNSTLKEYVYYQLPCSWGAVYEEKKWTKFINYLKYRSRNTTNLELNLKSNDWSQSWKRFLIEYMYAKGYFLIYPNYEYQVSYSTNYYEVGVHNDPKAMLVDPDKLRQVPDDRFQVPLVMDVEYLDNFPTLQEELPWINIHNRIVKDAQDVLTEGQEWIKKVEKLDLKAAEILRE